jgi:predicted RNase H-like HicB family nuclease
MSFNILKSRDKRDYEILIRKRGDNEYASYCPQLNVMLTGTFHEEVEGKMEEYIENHIKSLEEEDSGINPDNN